MSTAGQRIRTGIAAAFLMMAAASAAEAQQSIWRFTGNCIDCANAFELSSYEATATLTLKDYLSGELNDNHFVSFVYDGSNLIDEYVVDANNFGGMAGNLTASPQSFAITFGARGFFVLGFGDSGDGDKPSINAGQWATCPDSDVPVESSFFCSGLVPDDFGNDGAFVMDKPTTTVPEPGTYALMAMGLGALTIVTRRRQRQ